MKTVKVIFSKRDKMLAGIVRALVVEVAGFAPVSGKNFKALQESGFYEFDFSNSSKADEFVAAVSNYIPPHWASTLTIERL